MPVSDTLAYSGRKAASGAGDAHGRWQADSGEMGSEGERKGQEGTGSPPRPAADAVRRRRQDMLWQACATGECGRMGSSCLSFFSSLEGLSDGGGVRAFLLSPRPPPCGSWAGCGAIRGGPRGCRLPPPPDQVERDLCQEGLGMLDPKNSHIYASFLRQKDLVGI